MVRLPPFTSVLPAGNGIRNLVQFITGNGNPSAWQVSLNVECSFGVVRDDGTEVKTGRPSIGNGEIIMLFRPGVENVRASFNLR